ncbi:MAG: regulatory protein RecX [Bdellovibrionales bacterium]|nr:regulatory protein RecX [Bdellovibrionales bacterium]
MRKSTDLKIYAYGLLAKREHSVAELAQKLRIALRDWGGELESPEESAESKEEIIQDVVDNCLAQGYLSDQRFAEIFFRARMRKGYGPQRIRQELKFKQVDEELIEQVYRETEVDWCDLARQVVMKKYSGADLADIRTKAKAYRFLMQKGFFREDVEEVMRSLNQELD